MINMQRLCDQDTENRIVKSIIEHLNILRVSGLFIQIMDNVANITNFTNLKNVLKLHKYYCDHVRILFEVD